VQFTTFNVPKAKSTGFELELLARVQEGLTLNGAVTYTDARYPNNCGGAAPPPSVATLCGYSLTNAPEWVLIGGFNYDRPLANNLTLGFNANIRYETDRRTSTQAVTVVAAGSGTLGATLNRVPAPFDIQDANAKVNLRLALGSPDDRWRIELWGNNVFDVQTRSATAAVPLRGVASLSGPANAGGIAVARSSYLQDPRTYGVTLRSKF
jgi:outer membrane receptor protein involved in Fe transport